jgi:hypothetical protein
MVRKIIVDETLRTRLHNLTETVDLCDASGQILARVVPAPPFDASDWEAFEPAPLSEEELERRRNEPTFSTAEVLAFLEKL